MTGPADTAAAAVLALSELVTSWLGWFEADEDDEPPFFPERRSEIADHLREVRAVLDEREQLAALAQLAALLGIGVDRKEWDAIAEAEGRRYEAEQTNGTIVGYLADRYEDMKAQRHILLSEIKELEAEREADVRAVAEACADFDDDEGPRGIRQLYARFADRIAALGQQSDVATRCCECGSSDVTYRNYLNQPFCGPCADGRGPVDGQDDTADGSAR